MYFSCFSCLSPGLVERCVQVFTIIIFFFCTLYRLRELDCEQRENLLGKPIDTWHHVRKSPRKWVPMYRLYVARHSCTLMTSRNLYLQVLFPGRRRGLTYALYSLLYMYHTRALNETCSIVMICNLPSLYAYVCSNVLQFFTVCAMSARTWMCVTLLCPRMVNPSSCACAVCYSRGRESLFYF